MKVAILGSGNVATHLSKALIKAGSPVKQVWSRDHNNAINFALEIGANSIPSIDEINDEIDLVIIAVADDAIAEVAKNIPLKSHQLVLHTSGSTSVDVLQSFENYGVLYPLQTFSKTSDLDFSAIPLFIEANNTRSQIQLTQLANQLSDKVTEVDSDARAQLHIAAVFACNFTNAFYAMAQEITDGLQLDFDLLRPLIQETADKAMLNSPKEVQTGPARRNDKQTLSKHLNLLQKQPDLQQLYQSISQYIVKMYTTKSAQEK